MRREAADEGVLEKQSWVGSEERKEGISFHRLEGDVLLKVSSLILFGS